MNYQAIILCMAGWMLCWGAWVTLCYMNLKASSLSRKEHAEICVAKDAELNRRFDKMDDALTRNFEIVTKALEKQDSDAKEFRHKQSDDLHGINLKITQLSTQAAVETAAAARVQVVPAAPTRRRPRS